MYIYYLIVWNIFKNVIKISFHA